MGQDYICLAKDAPKQQKYQNIIKALEERIQQSAHPIANRGNLLALLKQQFNWWWIGFYFVYTNKYGTNYSYNQTQKPKNKYLSLGSFQGPPACVQIFKGSGVCGKCWQKSQTIIVPNVNQFQGHISCSSKSQSQIVIPIYSKQQQFIGLLDIDSEYLASFDETDSVYLNKIIRMYEQRGLFNDWVDK